MKEEEEEESSKLCETIFESHICASIFCFVFLLGVGGGAHHEPKFKLGSKTGPELEFRLLVSSGFRWGEQWT
jgi:hypothetical protein